MSDHFSSESGIPASVGSLFNFNQEAFDKLQLFETFVKDKLTESIFMPMKPASVLMVNASGYTAPLMNTGRVFTIMNNNGENAIRMTKVQQKT